MFNSLEEAVDTNSTCAYCHLMKFKVCVTYLPKEMVYTLERCKEETCKLHCSWDHDYGKLQLDIYGEDAHEIASGWGLH